MIDSLSYFSRRHLPHYYPDHAAYFVTFRLANSLPHHLQSAAIRPTHARFEEDEDFARIDNYLDSQAYIPSWLSQQPVAKVVWDTILKCDVVHFDLAALTIMSNHVHLVFGRGNHGLYEPSQAVSLSGIPMDQLLQNIKGSSAYHANRKLGRKGQFWQHESYDHVIRSGEEMLRILQYVIHNPVKAGLAEHWRDWRWTYLKEQFAGIV